MSNSKLQQEKYGESRLEEKMKYLGIYTSYGHVVRDFESEAKTR